MNKRKTNKEVQTILRDCFMKSNDIFNIKAIMKETGLMRQTVVAHKDEVMQAIRNDSILINKVKETMI